MFIWISILTAIVILLIASIEDLKTREIPDYVSYGLLGAAVFIRILWALFEQDISVVIWAPVSFVILGGFSYMMYKGGQWGGGDVKILMGLSILLCSFKGETIPFFISLLFNTLLVGAFYGAFGIGIMSIKNRKKIKWNWYEKLLVPVILIAGIWMFYVLPSLLAFFGVFILISLISLVYFKKIEKVGMQSYIPVEKLTEGDWLVNDIKLNGKVYLKKRNIGLTFGDIRKLKKSKKIKKVLIKIGIPFSPVFLISTIVTLAFGNLLFLLFLIS